MSIGKNLQELFLKMDSIEGTTEGGRQFNITYGNDLILKLQIITSDNEVYETNIGMYKIVGLNILSTVNKIEKKFFNCAPFFNRIHRKSIAVTGHHGNEKFTADLIIENKAVSSKSMLNFRNKLNYLNVFTKTPEYIDNSQMHNWLYLHYQKPENWIGTIVKNIKNNYITCCGVSIRSNYNYCPFCGKKQEVSKIVIDDVVGKEFLTKLT